MNWLAWNCVLDLFNGGHYARAQAISFMALDLAKNSTQEFSKEQILMFSSILLQCFLKEKHSNKSMIKSYKDVIRDGLEVLEETDLVRTITPSKRPTSKSESTSNLLQMRQSMEKLFRTVLVILQILDGDEQYKITLAVCAY